MPAVDVVKLYKHERDDYDKQLRLLFAASGDLRNVFVTIANLPQRYTGTASSFINDKDFDIVARNLIILLIAIAIPDESVAVDCMLYVWYLAQITHAHLAVLHDVILPLIQDVNTNIADRLSGKVYGKTWTFGHNSCRVELSKFQWDSLLSYLTPPQGLSVEGASRIRVSVTLAPELRDRRDRHLAAQTPAHRVCIMRFREDGILLPFSLVRKDFTVPNPTFYQHPKWPMHDSADPLNGWTYSDVLKCDNGPAANDLYGKLYIYVCEVLIRFRSGLIAHRHEFYLFCIDAIELQERLSHLDFARIEVANISDGGYLGAQRTVGLLGQLLQDAHLNPHATLLTLFMNAVAEVANATHDVEVKTAETLRAREYLSKANRPQSRYDVTAVLAAAAIDIVREGEAYFKKYMEKVNFRAIETVFSMRMKFRNTIIKEWPIRLRLAPGQRGA